jgi:hypothetical protein
MPTKRKRVIPAAPRHSATLAPLATLAECLRATSKVLAAATTPGGALDPDFDPDAALATLNDVLAQAQALLRRDRDRDHGPGHGHECLRIVSDHRGCTLCGRPVAAGLLHCPTKLPGVYHNICCPACNPPRPGALSRERL